MTEAVYAGSFDPITNGHLWMIEEGVKLFGELVVAIGVNPDKKPTFTVEERVEMLDWVTYNDIDIPGQLIAGVVTVDSFESQYLVRYAASIGAKYILRGIRSEEDYAAERRWRHINDDLSGEITTIFLIPPRELTEVSSTMVKGMIGPEGWEEDIKRYIPGRVHQALLEKYSRE